MAVLAGLALAVAQPCAAQQSPPSLVELKRLSVTDLMNLEVTSVSKSNAPLGRSAAAVTVLTEDDIKRSGATTVPDALRLVPGLHVARQTSSAWAVGARGFTSVSSEKLLVLSDTRSIYTPLYSGVFWDVQDYLLHDVERIEIIRGPGATLWGANAVNGVINITTKSAKDTQGGYAETSVGTEERVSVAARYGGRIANGAYYRVFGKYFDRASTFNVNPASPDDWRAGHLGFRSDWDVTARDVVTVQGEGYRGDVGQVAPSVRVEGRPSPEANLRIHTAGANVLTRWRRTLSLDSDFQVRLYYDRTHRDDPAFVDDLDTVDLDAQHRFLLAPRHKVTWGANYRFTANQNDGKGLFALEPPSSHDHLLSGFAQDRIRLMDSLHITIGSKLEHNDFSGVELQPSGRVGWEVARAHFVWGAVSRAVRVPTRLERDLTIDVTDPATDPVFRLIGNPAFESERLLAYEVGHRWQTAQSFSVDLVAFHNRYRGLAALEFGDPFVDARIGRTVMPLQNENVNAGRAAGVETLVTYAPTPSSRVSASYSFLDLEIDPGGQDLNRGRFVAGSTPRHQVGLRASLDLPANFQLDGGFRRLAAVERIPEIAAGGGVAGYSELDLRLAWRGWDKAEIAIVGQNLLHNHHPEFGGPASRGEAERSVYARIAWGF
jgi:iron complex outermembrane receptor protein